MTIKELIEQLYTYHPDMEVLMSRDDEGNAFHTIYEMGVSSIVSDGHEYDVYSTCDPDKPEDSVDGLVLWPL